MEEVLHNNGEPGVVKLVTVLVGFREQKYALHLGIHSLATIKGGVWEVSAVYSCSYQQAVP